MVRTGRAALFFGPGKPFGFTELPVPEPEPGALVMRVTRANVCGSDLDFRELPSAKERVARVRELTDGAATSSASWWGGPRPSRRGC